MFISGRNNVYGNRVNERAFGFKALEKPEKKDKSITEKMIEESQGQKEDSVEISPEGRLAVEQEKGMQELALLQKDLSDCKAGLEKGWCDESEIAKVEALMNRAKARMSEVPQEAEQEGGLDEFAMASLM